MWSTLGKPSILIHVFCTTCIIKKNKFLNFHRVKKILTYLPCTCSKKYCILKPTHSTFAKNQTVENLDAKVHAQDATNNYWLPLDCIKTHSSYFHHIINFTLFFFFLVLKKQKRCSHQRLNIEKFFFMQVWNKPGFQWLLHKNKELDFKKSTHH